MGRNDPEICANCEHWDCFDVVIGEFPEDECGACLVKMGEVMFGDEAACEMFDECYYPRVREEDWWG